MALGEASVRILPDVSDFEKQLLSAVQSAMGAAQGAVDDAVAGISGSFDVAATEAESALSSIDGDGFGEAVGAADAAAAEVVGAMDGAASEADAALSSVDGDGFGEASAAADEAGKEIAGSFEEASQKSSRFIDRIDFSNLAKGGAAFLAVTSAVRGFIREAEAGSTSEARIRQIATSMGIFGENVEGVTERLSEYASATALATGVDDDSIMMAQAKLLTFRELAVSADQVGGSFDRATAAAIDLAAAGFGSAESNAVQLGKALQDPIKGLTALARSGVTFTETEKERIRTLVESNEIGEAQRLILSAIETQVGGTAVATANATDKMAVGFAQVQEELGKALLPALDMVTSAALNMLDAFSGLPDSVKSVITAVGVAGTAFYAGSRALQGLGLAASTANKSLGAIGIVLTAAVGIYSAYAGNKRKAEQATNDFVEALAAERAGQEGATRAAILAQIADDERISTYRQLGLSIGDVALAVEGRMSPAMSRLTRILEEGRNGTLSYEQINEQLGAQFNTTLNQATNFMIGVTELTDRLNLATLTEKELEEARRATAAAAVYGTDVTDKQANATSIYARAASGAALSTEELEAALAEEEQAALDADSALQALISTTLSMFNTQLQLETATFRTNDSIGEFNTVLAQVNSGALKGEAATRALAEAQNKAAGDALAQAATNAKLAEEMALASGASFTAADAYRVQRDALLQVANQLDPNSPLRKQLLGYIATLNNQIPREIATRITASLNIRPLDVDVRRLLAGRETAEGGVFSSAQTRVIAEAGREAVIPITKPARAMELMELSGLADMVRSSSGGAMVNIQQATFASATDADLVAQRLNTALRVRAFAG